MRLSLVCLGLLKKRIPGNLYRGKNRIVRPVTARHMKDVRKEFDRQDEIMYLLRYPYLTVAECQGVNKALQIHENKLAKLKEAQQLKGLRKDITIVERLYHLTGGDKWE